MSLNKFIWSTIGKKVAMSLSGASLGIFLLIHVIGNSTTFWGSAAFISYASHLHDLGPLVPVFELGLLIIFTIHITFAVFLYFDNLAARPKRYRMQGNAGGRTWGSKTMPYTGLLILLFVIMHLTAFRGTEPTDIAILVRRNLSNPLIASYYIISLTALIVHTNHGFWSMLQSLGLTSEKYEIFIKHGTKLISIAGGLVFIAIPILIMCFPDFLN